MVNEAPREGRRVPKTSRLVSLSQYPSKGNTNWREGVSWNYLLPLGTDGFLLPVTILGLMLSGRS